MNKNTTTWHGTDISKSISLFEYGLLVRYVPKERCWQCIYRSGANSFSFGWMDDKTLEETLTKDITLEDRELFLKTHNMAWEQWIERPIANRIGDFITYFGADKLFGIGYSRGVTTKEMCQRFKIKYKEEFEAA